MLWRVSVPAYIVLHGVIRVHLLRKISNGCGRGELKLRPVVPFLICITENKKCFTSDFMLNLGISNSVFYQ